MYTRIILLLLLYIVILHHRGYTPTYIYVYTYRFTDYTRSAIASHINVCVYTTRCIILYIIIERALLHIYIQTHNIISNV